MRVKVSVKVTDNATTSGEPYTIQVKPGSGVGDSVTFYLSDSSRVVAHEMAHRIFNAREEYAESGVPLRPEVKRHFPRGVTERASLMQDAWSKGVRLSPNSALGVARMMQAVTGEQFAVAHAKKSAARLLFERP